MTYPAKPGTYWGREISLDFIGQKILGLPCQMEVVADVPNERGHKLLVKTGRKQPRYRSLNCFEFGEPTESESAMWRQLSNQQPSN